MSKLKLNKELLPNTIETGSNANGYYVKFDDGTMICYNTKTYEQLDCNNTIGNLSATSNINVGNFPVPFVGVLPSVSWNYAPVDSGSYYGWISNAGADGLSVTLEHPNSIIIMRSTPASFKASISYIAIGRWK